MASRAALVEELRWKKFPVLDDGFVCLVDVMGDDGSVVQAARVSYGEGTKRVSDDRTLIRYLMRHRHTTPFEMAEIKLLVRVPMDCWRQWIRHRMASVNEYSTRYSIAIDSTQTTPPDLWRSQAQDNRQGSGVRLPTETGAELSAGERKLQEECRRVYQERLDRGVAREQARKDLPSVDLHGGVLEDRSAQSAAFPLVADGRARAAGDPRLRPRDRAADHRAALSDRLGSVSGLSAGGDGADTFGCGRDRAA